jgi:magnesium-transporting ATPase (P-type)
MPTEKDVPVGPAAAAVGIADAAGGENRDKDGLTSGQQAMIAFLAFIFLKGSTFLFVLFCLWMYNLASEERYGVVLALLFFCFLSGLMRNVEEEKNYWSHYGYVDPYYNKFSSGTILVIAIASVVISAAVATVTYLVHRHTNWLDVRGYDADDEAFDENGPMPPRAVREKEQPQRRDGGAGSAIRRRGLSV